MADRSQLWAPVAAAGATAIVIAALGATLTDLGPWYQSLERPDWSPPDWAFGPVWTIILAMAAISAATAWRTAPRRSAREWLVALFALNGFLNVMWSLLFFRLQRPDWAFYEAGALWFSVLALIIFTGRWSRLAALLLIPYLVWVGLAAGLNHAVVQANGPFG